MYAFLSVPSPKMSTRQCPTLLLVFFATPAKNAGSSGAVKLHKNIKSNFLCFKVFVNVVFFNLGKFVVDSLIN